MVRNDSWPLTTTPMPTYEYKCDACGHAFEKFHSITAAPVRKCPKCGKRKVKRLLSIGAGMIFKGSGFYTTDYRSESYKSAAKADGGSAAPESLSKPAEGKPADGKSAEIKPAAKESKPAAKADKPSHPKK